MLSSTSPLPSKTQARIDITRTKYRDILRTEFIDQCGPPQEKISAGEAFNRISSAVGSIQYKGRRYVFDHRSHANFNSPSDILENRPVVCNPNHYLYFDRIYRLQVGWAGRDRTKFWFKPGKTEKRKTSLKLDLPAVDEEQDNSNVN